jgi:hypothetical protein
VLIGEDRGGEAAGEDPVVDGLLASLTWRAGIAAGGVRGGDCGGRADRGCRVWRVGEVGRCGQSTVLS